MPQEFSAGGVVLRPMHGRWWVAAIVPESSAENHARPVLALPKGMIDAGESPEQTALREVREETGIEADLIAKLSDIRYVYIRSWSDGQRIFKMVSFYLLSYRSGEIGKIAPEMRVEVRRAEWIPLDEAFGLLSYRGERDVIRLAQEYVASHAEISGRFHRDNPGTPHMED